MMTYSPKRTVTVPIVLLAFQEEVKKAGMLEVKSQDDWKEAVVEILREAKSDFSPAKVDRICHEIERAGKATCRVRRSVNSLERIKFLEGQIKKYEKEKMRYGKCTRNGWRGPKWVKGLVALAS